MVGCLDIWVMLCFVQGSLPSCPILLSSALTTLLLFFVTLTPRGLTFEDLLARFFLFIFATVRVCGVPLFNWQRASCSVSEPWVIGDGNRYKLYLAQWIAIYLVIGAGCANNSGFMCQLRNLLRRMAAVQVRVYFNCLFFKEKTVWHGHC